MASSISADGSTVVGYGNSPLGREAMRWTMAAGMVGLGDLPGGFHASSATAVSGDGSLIVGVGNSQTFANDSDEGFTWTSGTGMVGTGDFPGGIFNSGLTSVTPDDTTTVGFKSSDFGREPTRNGVSIYTFNGSETSGSLVAFATDVSTDGSVVVGRTQGPGYPGTQPFRWTQATGMVLLGDLPGGNIYTLATAVSEDGNVIVGIGEIGFGNQEVAFRWTSATGLQSLGDLAGGGDAAIAWDVTADGNIIVGQGRTGLGDEAFLWDPINGMRHLASVLSLDYGLGSAWAGWTLTSANAITSDGRTLVGSGINPSGNPEAWMVTLSVPDGSPLGLLGSVAFFAGLLAIGRKQSVHPERV